MFESLFGAEMSLPLKFVLVFLFVLVLLLVFFWALRRFGAGRFGGPAVRGRQPRLAVIDFAAVGDGRRRLILVRRDNVEHLLMIGGPTDVVIEPNIVRAVGAPREVGSPRPPAGLEALPRAVPLPEAGNGSWPLQPEPAGAPRPSARTEPAPEEPPGWPLQPSADARPPRDTLAALADELSTRPVPPRRGANPLARPNPPEPRQDARPEPRSEPRSEPRAEPRLEPRSEPRLEPRVSAPAPAAPPAPPAAPEAPAPAGDESLAEMAQRLEAALRRPNAPEARPPVMPGRAAPPPPPVAEPPQAGEPSLPPPPPPSPRGPRLGEPKPARTEGKPNQSKAVYDSLEQEMASLLGRPTKT